MGFKVLSGAQKDQKAQAGGFGGGNPKVDLRPRREGARDGVPELSRDRWSSGDGVRTTRDRQAHDI